MTGSFLFRLSLFLQEQEVTCAKDTERHMVWTCLSKQPSLLAAVELISYTKARWLQEKKRDSKYYQEIFRIKSLSREKDVSFP